MIPQSRAPTQLASPFRPRVEGGRTVMRAIRALCPRPHGCVDCARGVRLRCRAGQPKQQQVRAFGEAILRLGDWRGRMVARAWVGAAPRGRRVGGCASSKAEAARRGLAERCLPAIDAVCGRGRAGARALELEVAAAALVVAEQVLARRVDAESARVIALASVSRARRHRIARSRSRPRSSRSIPILHFCVCKPMGL